MDEHEPTHSPDGLWQLCRELYADNKRKDATIAMLRAELENHRIANAALTNDKSQLKSVERRAETRRYQTNGE